jgi:hypothetical protein
MRITAKGQVTTPQEVRDSAGLMRGRISNSHRSWWGPSAENDCPPAAKRAVKSCSRVSGRGDFKNDR